MSRSDFLKEWEQEWRKFSNKPMFAALLSVIDDESPARKITGRIDGEILHGGPVLAAEILGHERLRKFLVELSRVSDKSFEPEDKFKESEL